MRLLFVLVIPALAYSQAPAQPLNCEADGSVVNSLTGEPIPRARVESMIQSRAGTTADAAGRWKISGLPCGRVNLSAAKTGFLSSPKPTPVLSADSPLHDLRLELIPQSVVTGKVLDEAGDPIQNANVLVYTSRVQDGRRSFYPGAGANSNDLGEFRISGLAVGKAILCALGPSQPPMADPPDGTVLGERCYPGPVEGGGASALNLAAGREARVDFTLARVPAARIRGRITGVGERTGAMVSLNPRTGSRGGVQSRPATMQPGGAFELRGVAPGAWLLTVDYWESTTRLSARVPVDVNGVDIDGIVVPLESGFVVTGNVRVAPQTGAPLKPQQIVVSLRPTDQRSGGGSTQWDKNHTTFTINDVTPGNYTLYVGAPPPFYLKSAMMGGLDISKEPISLNQAGGAVDVVLADDAGILQGRLEDASGDPASGMVMLLRDGHPPIPSSVGPDGRFRIAALAPGDYRVYGWDDFQQVEYNDPDWMRRNGGSAVTVTISAGQTADTKVIRTAVPRE
jgi:hypothetical protein